jgi:hypothetical protein
MSPLTSLKCCSLALATRTAKCSSSCTLRAHSASLCNMPPPKPPPSPADLPADKGLTRDPMLPPKGRLPLSLDDNPLFLCVHACEIILTCFLACTKVRKFVLASLVKEICNTHCKPKNLEINNLAAHQFTIISALHQNCSLPPDMHLLLQKGFMESPLQGESHVHTTCLAAHSYQSLHLSLVSFHYLPELACPINAQCQDVKTLSCTSDTKEGTCRRKRRGDLWERGTVLKSKDPVLHVRHKRRHLKV